MDSNLQTGEVVEGIGSIRKLFNIYHEVRFNFVNWCFLGVCDRKVDPIFILFISENWFQLSGYVDPHK